MRSALLFLVPFAVAIALTTSSLSLVTPTMTLAAEDNKPAKKKKPDTSVKPGKPKSTTPKSGTASGADAVDKAQTCYGDAPKIESVSPDEGTSGAKVTITGKNFGSPGCLHTVSFGPGHTATFEHNGQDRITATVPAKGRKGLAILTVTTASGEDSKPFLMK